MIQGITDKPWQAEARTSETKQFIRDIKCHEVQESGIQ